MSFSVSCVRYECNNWIAFRSPWAVIRQRSRCFRASFHEVISSNTNSELSLCKSWHPMWVWYYVFVRVANFSAFTLFRGSSGGFPPFGGCHPFDCRYTTGAQWWDNHAFLWRPAPWFLSSGYCGINCSSDLCSPRDLALYLHACSSGLPAALYRGLYICEPGYLCGPQHQGAEGETHTAKEKDSGCHNTYDLGCCNPYCVEKINFYTRNQIGASNI